MSADESPGLGIDRTQYVALSTPDPEGAAKFADEHLGLELVHADSDGRHYLAAAGSDPYSLVYVPGENGIDHISLLVNDLQGAHSALEGQGIESEIEESGLWSHEPALRFQTPGDHRIELTTGVKLAAPMSHITDRPKGSPAPIVCDHVVTRVADVETELAFASGTLGLFESGRIEAPGVGPVLTFFRAHTLYHCYAIALGQGSGLHHFEFTVKDRPALFEAYESMRDGGAVDVAWGPVRHGPGHNICIYVRDFAGNVIEYAAEEEVILDNNTYVSQTWSAADQNTVDEWGSRPPDGLL